MIPRDQQNWRSGCRDSEAFGTFRSTSARYWPRGTILWGSFRRQWISSGSVRSLKRPLDGLAARRSDRPRQHLPRQVLGVDQPQIRGRGQCSKSGCLRQRLDPQSSGSGQKRANEISGRHRISRRSCRKPRSCRVEIQCESESLSRPSAKGWAIAQDRPMVGTGYFFASQAPLTSPRVKIPAASSAFGP